MKGVMSATARESLESYGSINRLTRNARVTKSTQIDKIDLEGLSPFLNINI